nr:PAS domain-containing sensor histidine kinase [Bacteroidota bacterium]
DIALGISPTKIKGKTFFICFISDITSRKLAIQELDKQKKFYEAILNKIPTDIAVFNQKHQYIFVNPGAVKNEELRKFIIGKDDFEYAKFRNWDISIAQKRRDKFEEIKNTNKEIRWEDNIIDNNGKAITHLRRLFPVHSDNGELTMVIGYGIDISERKAMEEKQAALVKQLSSQNIQLNDFCNIVSHNLRAPLINIAMLVKFIEENNSPEEQKQMIAMLNPVISNLQYTFNELVESIHIKHDHEIKNERLSFQDCLKRIMDVLDIEIKNTNAVIDINFDAAPAVNFPHKYLYSTFHNLLSNALKYRSPQRRLHIKIHTKIKGSSIIFSITDNGLGIDLEKHKENFFKIGRVFHRHPNSKGFGLYMTKTQVEAMGGKIWAESKPDSGSTFFIEFKNQN